MVDLPLIELLVYSLTLWSGLYLVARDWRKPGIRYAGLGLISYALGLGAVILFRTNSADLNWFIIPLMLPAVFWMVATLYLIPELPIQRHHYLVIYTMIAVILVTTITILVLPEVSQYVAIALPIAFAAGVASRFRQIMQSDLPRNPLIILFSASIFFGLSTGLIIFPISWFQNDWTLLAISFDILLLGYAIAVLDAYDEGTTLLPDALRSLSGAALAVIVFGGQVLLVMSITENTTGAILILLFTIVTTILLTYTLMNMIQSILDNAVLPASNGKIQERSRLRAVTSAVMRLDESHKFQVMNEDEFARLTRRAISHYTDLDKLASSPLIRLPIIDERLQEQDQDDNILTRTSELKTLIRESIEQLKPDEDIDFSSGDEWRYYNALYFPYIVGIKPYSRRFAVEQIDSSAQEALQWLRTYVPERTLYNWQKTAAGLVARHLHELTFQTST